MKIEIKDFNGITITPENNADKLALLFLYKDADNRMKYPAIENNEVMELKIKNGGVIITEEEYQTLIKEDNNYELGKNEIAEDLIDGGIQIEQIDCLQIYL